MRQPERKIPQNKMCIRDRARDIEAVFGITIDLFLLEHGAVHVGDPHRIFVGIVVVVAVMMDLVAVNVGIDLLVAGPVGLAGLHQLLTGDELLLKHHLLDSGQNVGAGAQAHALGAIAVEAGAAHDDVAAIGNTIVIPVSYTHLSRCPANTPPIPGRSY